TVVATSPGYHDSALRMWDAATGRPLFAYPAHDLPPLRIAFTPDGQTLASYGHTNRSDDILRWDPATGQVRSRANVSGEDPFWLPIVRFSPDLRLAARAEEKQVRLLDPSTGKVVRQFPLAGGKAIDAVFSPGGDLLAVATADGSVQIREV